MKKVGVVAVFGLVSAITFGSFVLGTGGGQSACGATAGDGTTATSHPAVDGYSGDQFVNAAAIMNAGAALGLGTVGQTIGVMTAMGESSLNNVDHGDAAGLDSRGLFQQRDSWGTLSQRMDPTSAATLFFRRLIQLSGWQQMIPTDVAHAIQRNADPNHYTPFFRPAEAVVASLIGGDAACAAGVSGNAQALAENLVTAIDAGKIVGSVPNHLTEIEWTAAGESVPNCGVDTRILQIITIAYNTFGKLGISDINRLCTGEIMGAGVSSAHYENGGGHAVDFYSLGGTATTGADANSIKLLKILDPIMSPGSGAGQGDCRVSAGDSLVLRHIVQFDDSCTHLHINVDPNHKTPLNLG
jgi:hypothetical protein